VSCRFDGHALSRVPRGRSQSGCNPASPLVLIHRVQPLGRGIDVVVEGAAVQVIDSGTLSRLAEAFTTKWDGRWQFAVREGRIRCGPARNRGGAGDEFGRRRGRGLIHRRAGTISTVWRGAGSWWAASNAAFLAERGDQDMSVRTGPGPAIPAVLEDPIRDKGTAFTESERDALGLTGRLPSAVLTLDQQAQRAYQQMLRQGDDLAKNVYMEQLHDRNEVLYYRVLADHLAELLPVVYDPVIGDAIEQYSHEYRRPRGLYLSMDRPDDMDKAFDSLGLGPEDVDLIVCSDAEEILGIGDWGVAGSMIAVGKLAVYTAAAGIDPRRVIPVSLDVGTNNEGLLNDPLYLGNRHARVRGAAYDAFIKKYLQTASARFPNALLHFEDFGADNARRILVTYRDQYRIFNDDMQGTGVITMAGLFSALKVTGTRWRDQRVVVFGGGTAGVGIADQIRDQMIRNGLDPKQAARQIWIVDLPGLLTDDMVHGMLDYQRPYVRPAAEVADWEKSPVEIDPAAAVRWPEMAALQEARADSGILSLQTVVAKVKPTILIGTSTTHGAFTKDVVEAMSAGVSRPVIFPLSNPTSKIEAMPADIITWSKGRALIATGLPIGPFEYDGVTYYFGQANNALVYPGLGLGTIVSGASKVTDGMLHAAAEAVAGQVDVSEPGAALLPAVENLRASSATSAIAVVKAANADGVASQKKNGNTVQAVQDAMWQPAYPEGAASEGAA
jgi:malate dehydrogenase (oxaloacetate-decarboxylating)